VDVFLSTHPFLHFAARQHDSHNDILSVKYAGTGIHWVTKFLTTGTKNAFENRTEAKRKWSLAAARIYAA
jgi:hypothetical protein